MTETDINCSTEASPLSFQLQNTLALYTEKHTKQDLQETLRCFISELYTRLSTVLDVELNNDVFSTADHGIDHLADVTCRAIEYVQLYMNEPYIQYGLHRNDDNGYTSILDKRSATTLIVAIGAMLHDIGLYLPGGERKNHNDLGADFVDDNFDSIISCILDVIGQVVTVEKFNRLDNICKFSSLPMFNSDDPAALLIRRGVVNAVRLHRRSITFIENRYIDILYPERPYSKPYLYRKSEVHFSYYPAKVVSFADKNLTDLNLFVTRSLHYIDRCILPHRTPEIHEYVDYIIKHTLEKTVTKRITKDPRYMEMLHIHNEDAWVFWNELIQICGDDEEKYIEYLLPIVSAHVKRKLILHKKHTD